MLPRIAVAERALAVAIAFAAAAADRPVTHAEVRALRRRRPAASDGHNRQRNPQTSDRGGSDPDPQTES